MPNCQMLFKDDPVQKKRDEDHLLGYTLRYAYNTSNPLNFVIAPMVKANFAAMKAATEFVKSKGWGNLEKGFVSSGASKRGWTAWMVAAVTCEDCVPIIASTPIVPIVPQLHKEMHRMFQSYNGFSWAFDPFLEVGCNDIFDEEMTIEILKVVDPLTYGERLARIPKMPVHASGDQFMDFTWPNIWYEEFKQYGEGHLYIQPDAEHSCATGIYGIISTMSTFLRSVVSG